MKRAAEASPAQPRKRQATGSSWTPPATTPFLPGRFPAGRICNVNNYALFNAGLSTSDSPDTVRVVASDLAGISKWFKGVLQQQKAAAAGSLDHVRVPCDVAHRTLQDLVDGMYAGHIAMHPGNFAELLQLAESMLIAQLKTACHKWAMQALQQEECTSQWVLQLHCSLRDRQVQLPEVEAAILEVLVRRCIPHMEDNDMEVLGTVLADRFLVAQGDGAAARTASDQLVKKLRSCLRALFGVDSTELFLWLLLLELEKQGLPPWVDLRGVCAMLHAWDLY